ncbi:hypothetical protein B7P43_G02939 [Cryptotermes secundus]|uniref:Uncharacterized protein n=1 Tax=Cryptotermes secundus TaxID=105785 RepID=A0A2J7Q113_9NEOP|nr:hypothetical protein B7P43_G02939 [Cryptotermes secundus]
MMGVDLEGNSHCPIEVVVSQHLPERTEENDEKPIMIAGVWTEIQIEHLQNTSLERYHYIKPIL